MASNQIIKAALKKSAAELMERNLTASESQKLEEIYEGLDGSIRERANQTLGKITGLSPKEIRENRASEDNADRAIRDLESLLDD